MNKQEAIEQINYIDTLNINDKTSGQQVDMVIKNQVLDIVNQIGEPQKPKVPQFVADWYEEHKDNFEYSIQCLCVLGCEPVRQIDTWFDNDDNKPIETLVKMKLFGYEVEKEKLYRVELPNPNGDSNRYGLCKVDGRIVIGCFIFGLNKASNAKLTEAEIKEDFAWAWKWAKEVEE